MDPLSHHGAGFGGGVALRLFTALHVPSDTAVRLADVGEALAGQVLTARAVEPAAMHVTYAWLGDVAEEYVPVVASALDAAAFEIPGPTSCAVSGAGLYGGGAALAADVDIELLVMLDAARDRFVDAVLPYAPDVDRRAWRPHVTLLRSARGGELPTSLVDRLAGGPPAASWVAPGLRLYASLPGPSARQHRLLHSAPFGAPVRNEERAPGGR